MLFAFFTACIVNNATGAIECANSYTEMTQVVRKGESCEMVAKELQTASLNSILIANPGYIAVGARSGCGTLGEVISEADNAHRAYQMSGIESYLYEF